jgi:DcuC family C4-dicarboxylate transporter
VPTPQVVAAVGPLLAVQLLVSLAAFWPICLRVERAAPPAEMGPTDEPGPGRVNLLKAAVPALPLLLLFLTCRLHIGGRDYQAVAIPQRWLVAVPRPPAFDGSPASEAEAALRMRLEDAHRVAAREAELSFNNRLIGAAMLAGVLAAVLTAPRQGAEAARAFFEGAGYALANVVSLIVVAVCLGKGTELAGLDAALGSFIDRFPWLFWPLAGFLPLGFGAVSGSGMAATQSLFGFFVEPAADQGIDPRSAGAVVALGAAGRTLSPAAAVTLMCATLTRTSPLELARRVAGPLVLATAATVLVRMAFR